MRRLALVVTAAVVLAANATAPTGEAAHTLHHAALVRHDALPLHPGSAGPRVATLKYLLRNPRPSQNVFRKVKGTYDRAHGMGGWWSPALTKALVAYRFRIGYPGRGQCGSKTAAFKSTVVTGYFFSLLRGRVNRPICWVALAQRRLRLVESGITPLAMRMKQLALSQLGVHEVPWGSNGGPRISYPVGSVPSYQSSTGAYRAAWCASFIQWLLQRVGYGRIADGSAGVLYIESWSHKRGFLAAKVKVGDLVAYLDDGGHIGFVARVTASGYAEISGNTSDAVRETWHPWNYRLRVFIALPRIA